MMERKAKLVAWAVAYENVEQARRIYYDKFKEEAPVRSTVHRWVQRFLETGDINRRSAGSGRPMTASGDHSQDTVQEAVSADPNVSIRQIAMDTGISKSSVGRCMKKLNLHPYSYTMVQELTGDDDDRRLEFCEWIRQRVSTNDNFYKQIVFSDEAVFHVNGTVNRHNLHYWNVDNPHVKFERFQDRQSVTVWCMLSSTGVIDYNIDFQTMNGERYCQVLQDKVIPFFTQRTLTKAVPTRWRACPLQCSSEKTS